LRLMVTCVSVIELLVVNLGYALSGTSGGKSFD
jgi:hypothetical protein